MKDEISRHESFFSFSSHFTQPQNYFFCNHCSLLQEVSMIIRVTVMRWRSTVVCIILFLYINTQQTLLGAKFTQTPSCDLEIFLSRLNLSTLYFLTMTDAHCCSSGHFRKVQGGNLEVPVCIENVNLLSWLFVHKEGGYKYYGVNIMESNGIILCRRWAKIEYHPELLSWTKLMIGNLCMVSR